MILLLILLVITSVTLFIAKAKSSSAYWMSFILLGWFLSMSGLILFIAKYSGFYFKINFALFLTDSVRRFLLDLPVSIDWISRMISTGRSIFIFSLIGFSLSLYYKKRHKYSFLLYLISALFSLVNVLIYDPVVYRNLIGFLEHNYIFIISVTTRIWLVTSAVFAFIMMLYRYRQMIIPWLRSKMKSFLLGIFALNAFYFYLGFMGPMQVTDVRTYYFLYSDFTNFNPPLSLAEWYIGISFTTVTSILGTYSLWKYIQVEKRLGKNDLLMERKLNTANMGVRVFTHAIKNQLLMTQLLINQTLETVESDSGQKIDKTKQNLNSTLDIINHILIRLDQLYNSFKTSKIHLRPVYVSELIEIAVNKLTIVPANIAVRQDIHENVQILSDHALLPEVINNILTNAFEAIAGDYHGKVEISTKLEDKWCIIQITDNGCGIAKHDLDNIFDPFFTNKNTNKNWGIGLSYAKQIVKGHFGHLLVESEVDKGTVFSIFLPVYKV